MHYKFFNNFIFKIICFKYYSDDVIASSVSMTSLCIVWEKNLNYKDFLIFTRSSSKFIGAKLFKSSCHRCFYLLVIFIFICLLFLLLSTCDCYCFLLVIFIIICLLLSLLSARYCYCCLLVIAIVIYLLLLLSTTWQLLWATKPSFKIVPWI